MGFLDHVNIIGSVANRESDFLQIILNESDDKCFLFRRNSAANNGFAFLRNL